MKFNVRNLTENDYEALVEWWDWWPGWVAPPKTFLPETGLMVTKNNINIAACYYYLTNSQAALIEWVISNPQYKDKDRTEALATLIMVAEEVLRKMGVVHVMTMSRHPSLLKIHKELGWTIDPKPSHEIIKNL